jgi:hypothetical protein
MLLRVKGAAAVNAHGERGRETRQLNLTAARESERRTKFRTLTESFG